MKLKYIRPLALALCAVLLCSLFTACSGTSSSSEQPSSAASATSDSASASASTSDSALPDSTTHTTNYAYTVNNTYKAALASVLKIDETSKDERFCSSSY